MNNPNSTCCLVLVIVITLPETNIAPENRPSQNGWLEYEAVSFWGPAYFQGRLLLVSGRVVTIVGRLGELLP